MARRLRGLMATWAENEELVRLGAYRAGASPAVDAAIARIDSIRALLGQKVEEMTPLEATVDAIEKITR